MTFADRAWSIRPPDASVGVEFRLAEPDGDAPVVAAWGAFPHVREWWPDLAAPVNDVHAYLVAQRAADHSQPWIATIDGQPFAYVETYLPEADPLAAHYDALASDRGWHVLVGPPELLGSGIPRVLGRAVLTKLFGDAGAERVICEPSIENTRMIRYCEHLGHVPVAVLDLPDKRALLLACTRASFAERFPLDLVGAEHGA
jgi:RimJ/RimL family protein N-acetyltransferase